MRPSSVFFRNSFFFAGIALFATSCYTAPEYPNEPEISFNNIVFSRGIDEAAPDSLILSINFQDGDGDLGLRNDGADTGEPYNSVYYYINVVNDRLLTYKDRSLPEYDTLPPFEFPYSCQNYVIREDIFDEVDTFYVQPNEFHHNIKIRYFVKKNGEYTEFDWETAFDPICGETFNGRYPILNTGGRDRPLEGVLKYKMESAGFLFLFRQDTLMLEVFIYDRALNKSNVIRTPDFVLQNITIGG